MVDLKENLFRVGIGKEDITPSPGLFYLSGYPRHLPFAGVHDRLFARSLSISDGRREVLIVSTDTFGFSRKTLLKGRNFVSEVRDRIAKRTGLDTGAIMLLSSHIHSAAETMAARPLEQLPGMAEWLETLAERIVSSAESAHNDTFDACLKANRGEAPGLAMNRRDEPCVDPEMRVLLFESPDKECRISIINFACHPVIVQDQDQVSGDFVGALETSVESEVGGMMGCLFIQGMCGDIDPITASSRNFDDVDSAARLLTDEALRQIGEMADSSYTVQPVDVGTASRTISLPSRPLATQAEIEAINENVQMLREEAVLRVEEGDHPFDMEIQVVRLGDVCITGVPGEPFCEMGIEIKKALEPRIGIPAGYCNGCMGYIATPAAWKAGGYEVMCGTWSLVDQTAHQTILDTIIDLCAKT
jgi:hypothetical protein